LLDQIDLRKLIELHITKTKNHEHIDEVLIEDYRHVHEAYNLGFIYKRLRWYWGIFRSIKDVLKLIDVKMYLIAAIKEIVKIGRNDVLCIIIGSGPLRKNLEKSIKKEKLNDYIKLIGAKPHNEIPLWMNAADLFVLPSLNEGNPTVMFEALGVGLPFIGTRVGGIPEVLVSEDYGFLVEPADPKDLMEKILISLEKDWDREKIRRYAGQFTLENVTRHILEIYSRVLSTYRD